MKIKSQLYCNCYFSVVLLVCVCVLKTSSRNNPNTCAYTFIKTHFVMFVYLHRTHHLPTLFRSINVQSQCPTQTANHIPVHKYASVKDIPVRPFASNRRKWFIHIFAVGFRLCTDEHGKVISNRQRVICHQQEQPEFESRVPTCIEPLSGRLNAYIHICIIQK